MCNNANKFKNNPCVRWLPLPAGNACAARNHGLANAQGKYVRFLDDDDYLLPEASNQLQFIETHNLDICSAPLESMLPDGLRQFTYQLPISQDFVTCAILSIGISGFTQGSLFKRSSLLGLNWREDISLYDDYFWMLDLAAIREINWMRIEQPAATYVQHGGARLSRIRRSNSNSRALTSAILQLHDTLKSSNRLTPERNSATASALLTHAHSAFPATPFLLESIIQKAKAIDPDAAPTQAIFYRHPLLAKHFLIAQWAMLLPRLLTRSYRRISWGLGEILERVHT